MILVLIRSFSNLSLSIITSFVYLVQSRRSSSPHHTRVLINHLFVSSSAAPKTIVEVLAACGRVVARFAYVFGLFGTSVQAVTALHASSMPFPSNATSRCAARHVGRATTSAAVFWCSFCALKREALVQASNLDLQDERVLCL